MTDAFVYSFAFEDRLKGWARVFGVTPTNSSVTVAATGLHVAFGRWSLSTPWSNVATATPAGPFDRWRVGGPPRLSLRDRGVTFATSTAGGVCLTFRRPVRGIEPSGLLRHPGATITVEDPDAFVLDVIERVQAASQVQADEPLPPTPRRGTFVHAASAIWRWSRRGKSVRSREREVDSVVVPSDADAPVADGQPISEGTGAWFHRQYSITVRDARLDGAAAMTLVQNDPNVLADEKMAPFNKLRGLDGQMTVGDRYVVATAGPWSGPVQVTARTPCSFRFMTLDGHMEAGLIEFEVSEADGELSFTIESWARSGDRAIDTLYDSLDVAKSLQSEMWVGACERFARLTGGTPTGPVQLDSERAQNVTRSS